jgi:ubiquinone/menaquinone biosynthesis C-methylase UbiE
MVRDGNRKYHDRVAGKYDVVYDTPYWRFYRDVSWRHLKPYIPERRPASAADLGCGTGWFGTRLLKAGCAVTFLDPSGKMLEEARAAVEREGSRGLTVRYVQSGMEQMGEIESASLDFATGQGDPLSFCEEPARALADEAAGGYASSPLPGSRPEGYHAHRSRNAICRLPATTLLLKRSRARRGEC